MGHSRRKCCKLWAWLALVTLLGPSCQVVRKVSSQLKPAIVSPRPTGRNASWAGACSCGALLISEMTYDAAEGATEATVFYDRHGVTCHAPQLVASTSHHEAEATVLASRVSRLVFVARWWAVRVQQLNGTGLSLLEVLPISCFTQCVTLWGSTHWQLLSYLGTCTGAILKYAY